jgi:glycosyltransferase involved in cell wall biosynthesis
VYNKEDYLDDCLTSIVSQEFKSLEILLINDGSKDKSLEICRKYAELDSRITVFDKENSGVSETRNFGIEKAKGQYLLFVDADDILANDFFLIINEKIENYDMLLYKSCRNYSQLGTTDKTSKESELESFTKEILKSVIYNQNLIKDCGFNFNRVTDYVVSAKLIKENNLRFNPALKVGEDKLFNFKLFQSAKNVLYINKYLYYILTNTKSVMGSYNKQAWASNKNLYDAFVVAVTEIENDGLKSELEELIPCLGYQVVWNTITSDFCHKDNKNKLKTEKERFNWLCKPFLIDSAKSNLKSYDSYLFAVFKSPFWLMRLIMKKRLLRGGCYYLYKAAKKVNL